MSNSNTTEPTATSFEESFLMTISIVNIIACVFTLFVYMVIYKRNSSYYKYVMFLAFLSLPFAHCNTYSAFLEFDEYDFLLDPEESCYYRGSLQQFGLNASTFIVFCMSLHFYFTVNGKTEHIKYTNICIAASMAIPGLLSLWFILSGKIEKIGYWCVININESYWQVTIFVHGFYALAMTGALVLYFESRSIVEKKGNQGEIMFYPLLHLCFLPLILLSQINYHFPGVFGDILFIIAEAIACSSGILITFAYALNKNRLSEFIWFFRRSPEDIELREGLVS